MSKASPWYQRKHSFAPYTRAEGEAVAAEFDAIQASFEKIPAMRDDGKGFIVSPIIPDPTEPNHPVPLKLLSKAEQSVFQSRDQAAVSAQQATEQANQSAASASQAQSSEAAANGSAINAANSERNADQSENLARRWASEEVDREVENGKYSAMHYAHKAALTYSEAEIIRQQAVQNMQEIANSAQATMRQATETADLVSRAADTVAEKAEEAQYYAEQAKDATAGKADKSSTLSGYGITDGMSFIGENYVGDLNDLEGKNVTYAINHELNNNANFPAGLPYKWGILQTMTTGMFSRQIYFPDSQAGGIWTRYKFQHNQWSNWWQFDRLNNLFEPENGIVRAKGNYLSVGAQDDEYAGFEVVRSGTHGRFSTRFEALPDKRVKVWVEGSHEAFIPAKGGTFAMLSDLPTVGRNGSADVLLANDALNYKTLTVTQENSKQIIKTYVLTSVYPTLGVNMSFGYNFSVAFPRACTGVWAAPFLVRKDGKTMPSSLLGEGSYCFATATKSDYKVFYCLKGVDTAIFDVHFNLLAIGY